jgi:GNAT superfamily N-acetyltransferase
MRISIENSLDQADAEIIRQGLGRYNTAHAGDDQRQPLAIVVRDDQGQVQGGLLGMIYWNWLAINIVWLHENLRGQGFGRQLMQMAEQVAIEHGCYAVHLDTFDFQAPDFYLRLGYTVWGRLDDLPPGHSRFYLKKMLAGPRPGEAASPPDSENPESGA